MLQCGWIIHELNNNIHQPINQNNTNTLDKHPTSPIILSQTKTKKTKDDPKKYHKPKKCYVSWKKSIT